ncbi:hypothetical protein [Actinacidiphila sp. ITFR-21]|uniref:hypothetical protein n=1 Tax=Actinacidiphila sp. ITFR-21 TaxID=3075199 RepID=UPI00288C130C|nr:hypothetical protein [Streptomyces sp. ITFR-21]WNI19425.1 hypothetical protein RLT57_30350 [Streptomyces sp. ITFR-21]
MPRIVTAPEPAAAALAVPAARAAPAGLRLAGAVGLVFTADSPTALDPDLRTFVGDLVRPYGLPPDERRITAGSGQSYAEMGEAVITALVAPDRPVDLLIEVFASPDVQPGRAASVHLSTYCPGRPFAFALCEQGTAGAFSALRLVASYLGGGAFRRALVLVVEASGLPYVPPDGTPVADRAAAVGLLWERDADLAVSLPAGGVRLTAPEAYERVVAALPPSAPGAEPLLLLGPGLAALDPPPGTRTLRARPGNPYTGLWTLLADTLPRIRQEGREVFMAEYDVLLGHLDLARVRGG